MRSMLKHALLALTCLLTATLSAQASRTWISGVGDDANPGSRTAPCKTFAGAISKTAAGGEIDCLDPGGFGAVTITKAITLDGGGGQVASILVSGTNAIVVQAGPSDVVVLRNLRFNGIGTGLSGVRFLAGKALIIENCFFDGFTTTGVDISLATAANVSISNTSFNGAPAATNYVGVFVESPSTQVKVDLDRVRVWNSPHVGMYFAAGKAVVRDSLATGGDYGVIVNGANVQMDQVALSDNNYGVKTFAGALRLSNCVITGNGTGVFISGGTVSSYGNNRLDGNSGGNGPLSVIAQQ
ncbi:MAG TPA: hypothetical protein VJ600_07980 [Holophagaceae bacterium]|nr:hypothetical protein [Holophagaceae bacterium]